MDTKEYLSAALGEVLTIARRVSEDVAVEVEAIFKAGLENPLSEEEARKLLKQIAITIKTRALAKGDEKTAQAIDENIDKILSEIVSEKRQSVGVFGSRMVRKQTVYLADSHNGIECGLVVPRPWFHGKEIPMSCGYIKTTDIQLWDENVRLDIHLGQFKEKYGSSPSPQDILDIMLSRSSLPGVTEEDQFEIVELARSISINGVRKPPIIDVDGTLLDGNRRVAACYYILGSDEFASEQKERAEYIFVWQLTPDATDDDRRRVIVSLNFEPDYKEEWPKYVKARKVYEEWQAMLALEPTKPGPQRQAQMKRELSQRYALGPDTATVNLFLKMVNWANDFEDYLIEERKEDKFSVKHAGSKYFEYFDELSKGERSGVAYCLGQDDSFKKLAFNLLYDGKFDSWKQIRKLKNIFYNDEARSLLQRAGDETNVDAAQKIVDEAVGIAEIDSAERRKLGANTRIESFVNWLKDVPVSAFRDEIKKENLLRLLDVLGLVRGHVEAILSGKEAS